MDSRGVSTAERKAHLPPTLQGSGHWKTTYLNAGQGLSKNATLLAVRCSDLLKAFIINLSYIKSGHLSNLLILAF